MICFAQKIDAFSLVVGFVGVFGLYEEGSHIFLEAHGDGGDELLDIKIGELRELIGGFEVVAEEHCIVGRDIVLLVVFIASVEEGNEVGRRVYAQVEELDDLQMAQIIILLDGPANALGYDGHLDVVLDDLQ